MKISVNVREKHMTNMCLSWQNTSFVVTKVCLSQQNFCHDKRILSQQQYCCNKLTTSFVMTKHIFCHKKSMLVMTKLFFHGKHTFVVTKDMFCHDKSFLSRHKLVATPARDTCVHVEMTPVCVCRTAMKTWMHVCTAEVADVFHLYLCGRRTGVCRTAMRISMRSWWTAVWRRASHCCWTVAPSPWLRSWITSPKKRYCTSTMHLALAWVVSQCIDTSNNTMATWTYTSLFIACCIGIVLQQCSSPSLGLCHNASTPATTPWLHTYKILLCAASLSVGCLQPW